MARRGKKTEAKIREVQEIFLASVEALAESPEQLIAAVNFGLDRAFDQLLRQACVEVGVPAEVFAEALDADPELQKLLQERLAALFTPSAVERARSDTQRRDAERHLSVLRFVLSGKEPAEWVWSSMDPSEVQRLRAFRAAGGEEDPELLARVERALEKLTGSDDRFGRCEACAGPILPERLALLPYAERCTRCQLALEQPASDGAAAKRVPLWMFFEGGKPVPPDRRQVG